MNPTLHRPLEIIIEPTIKSSERPVPEELCNMKMRYRPEGAWQNYLEVWVPQELQLILTSGNVHSVHVETLEDNGTATHALGYPAAYAVLGVETKARK